MLVSMVKTESVLFIRKLIVWGSFLMGKITKIVLTFLFAEHVIQLFRKSQTFEKTQYMRIEDHKCVYNAMHRVGTTSKRKVTDLLTFHWFC